jgi:hypothetical protein
MLYVEESLNFLSEGEIEHALDVERPHYFVIMPVCIYRRTRGISPLPAILRLNSFLSNSPP